MSTDERVPPHSNDAEIAVLGAVMLEPGTMDALVGVLRPEDFYRADHEKLYAAFVRNHENGGHAQDGPIDLLLTKKTLCEMGAADVAANADLFMRLAAEVPSVANARYYAGIVRDLSQRRAAIMAAFKIQIAAYSPELATKDLLADGQRELEKIALRTVDVHAEDLEAVLHGVVADGAVATRGGHVPTC